METFLGCWWDLDVGQRETFIGGGRVGLDRQARQKRFFGVWWGSGRRRDREMRSEARRMGFWECGRNSRRMGVSKCGKRWRGMGIGGEVAG